MLQSGIRQLYGYRDHQVSRDELLMDNQGQSEEGKTSATIPKQSDSMSSHFPSELPTSLGGFYGNAH